MTTLHEQARAEAEKRWPHHRALRDHEEFIEGFLAGHEAATRARVVSTVTELDALPIGSLVRTTDDAVWQHFRVSSGRSAWRSPVWAGAYTSADLADYGGGLLPARVLYEPEEKP